MQRIGEAIESVAAIECELNRRLASLARPVPACNAPNGEKDSAMLAPFPGRLSEFAARIEEIHLSMSNLMNSLEF